MDFIATWTTGDFSYQRIHDDGQVQVGRVILPPVHTLQKHALAIVRGGLLADRIGGVYETWEPDDCPLWQAIDQDPGMLTLKSSHPKHHGGRDNMGILQWDISWRIAADSDSYGWSAWYMTPALALAHMIAACEEHEKEVRSELLGFTGGLS